MADESQGHVLGAPIPRWEIVRRSLRFRLTLWYTSALALMLALTVVLAFLAARHLLLADTDGFLTSEAHRIAAVAAGRPNDPPDPADLATAIASANAETSQDNPHLLLFNVVYVRFVSHDSPRYNITSSGLTFQPKMASFLNPLLSARLPNYGRYDFVGLDDEHDLRALTMPVRIGARQGILQVAVPWDHNADILENLALLLALCFMILLPAAACGGWILVGKTLLPIRRIVAEAERLDAAALPEALLPQAAETDSEVGQLVATLNRMTTRLRLAFEAQRRFAADASHELRTPLTILRGEMDLSLSRARSLESYQTTIKSAVEEIDRMSRIVESLSFLARQDAGQQTTRAAWRRVDLRMLCQEAVEEFMPMAHLKQISLENKTTAGEASLTVQGNHDQLLQIVRNLADNALKFTPSGGQVSFSVTHDADAQKILLTVADTGIGIEPQDLPHVFARFWRADQSRSGNGSGLGLSLCQEIACLHEGTMQIDSCLGEGTRFTLVLPVGDTPSL